MSFTCHSCHKWNLETKFIKLIIKLLYLMLNVSLNVKIRLDIKVVHMFYVELFINSAIGCYNTSMQVGW